MSRADKAQINKQHASLRTRAIKRILAGESPEFIATVFKVHRSTIYNWLKRYREGDSGALKSRPITGRPRKLTEQQETKLLETIIRTNPLKLNLGGALWTVEMIRQRILVMYGITFSAVQVGRLLKSFGVSCERPLTRIANFNLQRMDRWLAEDHPAIKAWAKAEQGEVVFVEIQQLRPSQNVAKGVREMIRMKTGNGKRKLYLFSILTGRGNMRFMISRGKPTPARFVLFLQRLMQGAEHPVYVVAEGKPYEWHQRVRKYLHSAQGKLKLYYLPRYMPELP